MKHEDFQLSTLFLEERTILGSKPTAQTLELSESMIYFWRLPRSEPSRSTPTAAALACMRLYDVPTGTAAVPTFPFRIIVTQCKPLISVVILIALAMCVYIYIHSLSNSGLLRPCEVVLILTSSWIWATRTMLPRWPLSIVIIGINWTRMKEDDSFKKAVVFWALTKQGPHVCSIGLQVGQ